MLHDLVLTNQSGDLLAIAKIDVTNDTANLMGKMVNVDHYSWTPIDKDDEDKEAKALLQRKIDDYLLRKQYVFREVVDILGTIDVVAKFNGAVLPTTTTTTTTEGTTTTTTEPIE